VAQKQRDSRAKFIENKEVLGLTLKE
jgi:hypothetical protein